MKRIQIAWAPNIITRDIPRLLGLILSPWKWFGDRYVRKLERALSSYLGISVYSFDSGRSALYALLKGFGIGNGDEVILQAFTCVALPNPILWVGATPIYIDVDISNFNIDIEDLRAKITSNTKAIIIQYTFGIAPDIEAIREICREYNILLIEDCCHNLGQEFTIDGIHSKAGTLGDAAIFSFGMEKIVSGTRGGFACVAKQHSKVEEEVHQIATSLKAPRFREIVRGITNPIVWKIKEHWGKLGDFIFSLFVRLRLLELGLTKLELEGKQAPWLPYRMPNPNAYMGLIQLEKIKKFNQHRVKIASEYYQRFKTSTLLLINEQNALNKKIGIVSEERAHQFTEPVWLRFPILVENAELIRQDLETKGIFLGNWYTEVIHCKDVDLDALKYIKGSCPNAEWLVERSLNLPTHYGMSSKDVKRITDELEKLVY
ncbi:DegT/DnrJ/EryC1/StrS aminotransferase family protein [Candidatus Dojkabacteria bacterium]|uniref:DegT/DnrJ/EryC1/StrS aminotransferase family protein n=1 Tax=Candidatus Dojkabacteria bacterium TaxID=2099670 RepID=A0A955LA04_9BACT|nr:DegT/DnrJ/EryC1/StrS aminotransferase family protein [Candidatus Dojkabacteria bacterium]